MSCIAAVLPSLRHGPVHTVCLALQQPRDSIIITAAHNACRYIAALLWFMSDRHHLPPSHPRSLDCFLLPPKYICPTARWLCQHPVYHPFFTAIAASRLASGCSRFYHSSVSSTALPFPPRRVAKCRVGLVAKLTLDSMCQNLSMHVTRTTLLIGGLAEKLAIPNDTIREHLRPVRVAQSTSVRLLQLKAIVRLRLCCLASKSHTRQT